MPVLWTWSWSTVHPPELKTMKKEDWDEQEVLGVTHPWRCFTKAKDGSRQPGVFLDPCGWEKGIKRKVAGI